MAVMVVVVVGILAERRRNGDGAGGAGWGHMNSTRLFFPARLSLKGVARQFP